MMRELAGKELGFGWASIAAMELLMTAAVFTSPASGSVPVFTDQRSTPQLAALASLDQTTETETRTASRQSGNHRDHIIRPKFAPRSQTEMNRSVTVGSPRSSVQIRRGNEASNWSSRRRSPSSAAAGAHNESPRRTLP